MPEAFLRFRRERLAWRHFDGEAVVIDLVSSMVHFFNASAALLWAHLEHGATATELVDVVIAHYEVDAASASADVRAWTALLSDRGWLEQTRERAAALPERVPSQRLPYVSPCEASETAFVATAGCGKVNPTQMSCIQVPRDS